MVWLWGDNHPEIFAEGTDGTPNSMLKRATEPSINKLYVLADSSVYNRITNPAELSAGFVIAAYATNCKYIKFIDMLS